MFLVDTKLIPRCADIPERWLRQIETSYAERLLPIDARVHDLTLVTRNASDVDGLGVTVLNPFDG